MKIRSTSEIIETEEIGLWVSLEDLKKTLDKYFALYDNADEYVCGCGCNERFNVVHGLVQRINVDLLDKLSLENKENSGVSLK